MDRYRGGYKEVYEQVGDFEYNEVNPYAEMANAIKKQYPDAHINKTTTEFEWHYLPMDEKRSKWMAVPLFTMFYSTEVDHARIAM